MKPPPPDRYESKPKAKRSRYTSSNNMTTLDENCFYDRKETLAKSPFYAPMMGRNIEPSYWEYRVLAGRSPASQPPTVPPLWRTFYGVYVALIMHPPNASEYESALRCRRVCGGVLRPKDAGLLVGEDKPVVSGGIETLTGWPPDWMNEKGSRIHTNTIRALSKEESRSRMRR